MPHDIRVGVLAFHGDVTEHMQVLSAIGYSPIEVRNVEDIHRVTHLIIPGGESPVISSFLRQTGVADEIKKRVSDGSLAVFGTCAGAIVLASHIEDAHGVQSLKLVDVTIRRNAFGSQLNSFSAVLKVQGLHRPVHAGFIRAPRITRAGKNVEVLAEQGGEPVLVRERRILLCTCHPEIRGETAIHELFLTM